MAPIERRGQEKYEAIWEEIRRSGFVRMRVDGKSYNVDEPPTSTIAASTRSRSSSIGSLSARGSAAGSADAVEAALDLGRGVMHVVHVDDSRPEPDWKVERFSQHYACDRCGRSFEPLNPHHFSFNSPLGWCPTCEGLGVQKGASPALLIRDPKLSIRQGAIAAWPEINAENPFADFVEAIARQIGFSLDAAVSNNWTLHTNRSSCTGPAKRGSRSIPSRKSQVPSPRRPGTRDFGLGTFPSSTKDCFPPSTKHRGSASSIGSKLDHLVNEVPCSTCGGSRLRDDAAAVRFLDRNLGDLCGLPLRATLDLFKGLKLNKAQQQMAGELLREITNRLQFLVDVGLDYLTLSRSTPTLSGGESQRIRLASQIGSGLTGVLYVLDEPTIGLHPRDNRRLLQALKNLRDLGNTLVLVEHDREVIAAADYLLDFGPGAGDQGGEVTAQGTPEAGSTREKFAHGAVSFRQESHSDTD